MNASTAVTLAGILAAGAAIGAYRTGVIGPQYAEVVRATPVTVREPIYADVMDAVPITETRVVPQQVCENRLVQVRHPERYGNRDGTVVGAVVGGLLGNQIGAGSGRTAATVAGMVGGGFAGHEIDRRHQGGHVTTQSQRVCHTEMRPISSTVGYDVRYQLDGQVFSQRVGSPPSDQIWLGERDRIIGYDVDWRYQGNTGTIRLDQKPGERLQVHDGAIVVPQERTAVAGL